MFSLIYGSTATHTMSDEELIELLRTCKEKNAARGVTGMLLYHDNTFLQVLEGEQETVEDLYAVIQKDERHNKVYLISRRNIKEREFGDWSMSFFNLHDMDLSGLKGYSDFLENSLDIPYLAENPSFATHFLQAFKQAAQYLK